MKVPGHGEGDADLHFGGAADNGIGDPGFVGLFDEMLGQGVFAIGVDKDGWSGRPVDELEVVSPLDSSFGIAGEPDAAPELGGNGGIVTEEADIGVPELGVTAHLDGAHVGRGARDGSVEDVVTGRAIELSKEAAFEVGGDVGAGEDEAGEATRLGKVGTEAEGGFCVHAIASQDAKDGGGLVPKLAAVAGASIEARVRVDAKGDGMRFCGKVAADALGTHGAF